MLYHFLSILAGIFFMTSSLLNAKEEFIRVEMLQGIEIAPYIPDIVQLCHQMYREYPYLYDGKDADYEAYLQAYADSNEAVICLVFNGKKAIGLAIGMPMTITRDHYKQPLLDLGYDLNSFFYLGEFVLDPSYRGQGYEVMMYQQVENAVRKKDCYKTICMWEVDDSLNPSQRPLEYVPNNSLWEKIGFTQHPELFFIALWTNINESRESPHLAVYWMKQL